MESRRTPNPKLKMSQGGHLLERRRRCNAGVDCEKPAECAKPDETWIGTPFFLMQRQANHGSGALTPAPEGAGGAAHGFDTTESAPGRRASNFNCW